MTKSTIEWTQQTWNPVTGCQKISPGCAHCYAADIAKRFWGDRPFTDVQFHEDRLQEPLKRRKPTTYFVNSMSDLFHESVTDEQLDQIFAVMALTPRHTYQVLTKRPQRMLEYLSSKQASDVYAMCSTLEAELSLDAPFAVPMESRIWPLPNVWMGVTVENQKTADERIPLLLQTPATVRFLSCEPLLEKVDISEFIAHATAKGFWVIVGGESGPKARPCAIEDIRSIIQQCNSADIPAFLKQLGSKPYLSQPNEFSDPSKSYRELQPKPPLAMWTGTIWTWGSTGKGNNPAEWPEDLCVREMPKCP